VSSRISEERPRSRIIAWGSYDESKPRVRLLIDELDKQGGLSARISIPVWARVRDKAVAGRGALLKALLRLIGAYPRAIAKLMRQPSGGAVLLGYPAIPDIFVLWAFARLRRHKVVFDAFISLYDTLVSDRAMVAAGSIRARLVWGIEWLALRLADVILVDTDQHGDFFAGEFGIPRERFQTILVGAEREFWDSRQAATEPPADINTDLPTILFYGQLIPLHGLDAILDAIGRTRDDPFRWLLIGSGQDEPKLRRFLDEEVAAKVRWLPWIDYGQLPSVIRAADVALGIFGTSDKAARVIPNKAFQIIAAGTPLITRESPAIQGLAKRYPNSIRAVPAGDGEALAEAARAALASSAEWRAVPVSAADELGPGAGVDELLARLFDRSHLANDPTVGHPANSKHDDLLA
jgi:glycosyltransferase involved in cell wall biosynthesis